MEPRCALCDKTVEELAREELHQYFSNRRAINISLSDELAYPYLLCSSCEDLLCIVVPKILEAEGIIAFDQKQDKYKLLIK